MEGVKDDDAPTCVVSSAGGTCALTVTKPED